MPRTKKNAKNERDGEDPKESPEERKYHVVITAQGSAVHWQSRVHYYWFLKIKTRCEEEATRQGGNACHMGGFTRVLHSGKPDELMNEIPTFVAQPLPPEKIPDGYVVLNRPYALLQWIQQAKIREKYVLMSEPDHIWLKPMPNLMQGRHAAAFPFFYIEPTKQEYLPIVRRYLGPITRLQAEEVAPIGNAPTLLAWDDLVAAAPVWYNMSLAIHADPEANKAWGWVQEMFAFTMSLYEVGVRDVGLHPKMMSQPPFDEKLEPWYLLHYTYGMDYTNEGVFTPGKYGEWRFDKREYVMAPPRQNLQEPPEACQNELVRYLIQAINEATQVIPGWQEYAATGTAKELWDGKTFA
jgi:hydroxyproline O-arabinosyltransferase